MEYAEERDVAEGIVEDNKWTNWEESCAYLTLSQNISTYPCNWHWVWIKVEYPYSEVDQLYDLLWVRELLGLYCRS